MKMYRQGDILLIAGDINRRNLTVKTDRIIAYGEATGHTHRMEGDATVLAFGNGEASAIEVGKNGAQLVHDEHATIELPEGPYRVIRQRQWAEGGWERVTD